MGQRGEIRRRAAEERDRVYLEYLIQGHSMAEIARRMGVDRSTVQRGIDRAMERRAQGDQVLVERAREIYEMRLNALWTAWYPLATGTWSTTDDDTGETVTPPPDPRAAEIALKLLDRYGLTLAGTAPPTVNNNMIFIGDVAQRDDAQQRILAALASTAQKQRVVAGELANAGTHLEELAGEQTEDSGPPPVERTPE